MLTVKCNKNLVHNAYKEGNMSDLAKPMLAKLNENLCFERYAFSPPLSIPQSQLSTKGMLYIRAVCEESPGKQVNEHMIWKQLLWFCTSSTCFSEWILCSVNLENNTDWKE